jgi:hypothetical protein
MNRAQIRTLSRGLTLIETDDWSEADLNTVIDLGTNVVASRFDWPFLAETASFGVTAGTQAYTFNTITDSGVTNKFLTRISSISRTGKHRLAEVGQLEATAQYGDDFPDAADADMFFVFGSSVYLIPVPSVTTASAYKVFYYRRPTLMTNDSDSPEWEPQFHDALVAFTVSKIWEREEDMEKAKYWSDRFDQIVEGMARFYLNRAEDRPIVYGGRNPWRVRSNTPFAT